MKLIHSVIMIVCFKSIFDTAFGSEDVNFTKVLSRRKRFLLFPDGCSLQLVFCVQTSALIPIGDIFLFGSTAALAWALPTDSKFLYTFIKDKNVDAKERGDVLNEVYNLDENGKVVAKYPYKRKTFNPTFAKRSTLDEKTNSLKSRAIVINRERMHATQEGRRYLNKNHMDESSIRFHRTSRIGLLEKLESLFKVFGWNGKQCVFRKLCESGRRGAPQGTFMHELTTILFTLPSTSVSDLEFRHEYDTAHSSHENCESLFPNCLEFDTSDKFTLNHGFSV